VVDSIEELESQIHTSTVNQHNEKQISCAQATPNSWYENIRFYLTHGSSPHNLDPKNKITLMLKSASFHLINDTLFRKNFDGVFLHCLEKEESEKVLAGLHAGDVDGHFGGDTIAHKVLRAGYYWSTLFRDSHTLSRKCVICQKVVGRVKKATFPLQPVTIDAPFQKWGLDIIGPINCPSLQQHKYILTTKNYFTRWSEALPLKVVNTNHLVSFLNSHIIT
jgi:hypothetical protein